MPTLTINDINKIIPISGSINTYVSTYSEMVCSEVDRQLNNIFANPLPTIAETAKQNYYISNSTGSDFVPIGAWQETGLNIKLTNRDNANTATLSESPLALGKDYDVFVGFYGTRIPGISQPVTAIKLLNRRLYPNEVLRVYGTYGWQAGYPIDLKVAIINVIMDLSSVAYNQATSGLPTGLTRIKSMTTEMETSDEVAKDMRKERDFMQNPMLSRLIFKYQKILTEGASLC